MADLQVGICKSGCQKLAVLGINRTCDPFRHDLYAAGHHGVVGDVAAAAHERTDIRPESCVTQPVAMAEMGLRRSGCAEHGYHDFLGLQVDIAAGRVGRHDGAAVAGNAAFLGGGVGVAAALACGVHHEAAMADLGERDAVCGIGLDMDHAVVDVIGGGEAGTAGIVRHDGVVSDDRLAAPVGYRAGITARKDHDRAVNSTGVGNV